MTLLELAEGKLPLLKKPLYVYNRSTMQNLILPKEQFDIMEIIRSKDTSCIHKSSEEKR